MGGALTTDREKVRKLQLVMPIELYEELAQAALQNDESLDEILRRFIKVGFLVEKLRAIGAILVVREANAEREVVLR